MDNTIKVDILGENNNVAEKIKLYKKVFGREPWNEGFVCGNCEKVLPMDFYGKCECGEVDNFSPYYSNSETKQEFEELAQTEGYKENIAYILDKMVGFMWGWDDNINNLNQHKLHMQPEEYKILQENIKKMFPEFDFEKFYYFSEIGIDKDFRGNDIAGRLYRENLKRLKEEGKTHILVRTTRNTDVPYKWFKKMGYKDVYFFDDDLQRVILAYKL